MTPRSDGRVLLGVLTPSSNTRLEPLTTRILAALPQVTAHFSRFRVLEVSFSPGAVAQFDIETILTAAELLADAQVDVIAWSGTSGGWTGVDSDRALCAAITERTGRPATTSTLALLEALRRSGIDTLALVSPYPDDMEAAIKRSLGAVGVTVMAAEHYAVTVSNWALSEIDGDTISRMVKKVAAAGPGAICTFCTNLAAADLVAGWETEFALPVYDSIALPIWHSLLLAGVDARPITGWGRLFALG